MSRIAGIDGCKGGWVVALREVGSDAIEIRVVEAIHEVLRWREQPGVIGIDIPIGLLDAAVAGGRACDQAARALLGQPRGCSVFSPPVRPTLRASSFEEALRLNRASSTHALGISRQSFGILRKIREVDDMMLPSLQDRVFEVHPEVSLSALHGSPMKESKKSKPGRSARIHALERAWRCKLGEIIETRRCSTVARDDIVDAMAACWTAERVHAGTETRLPAEPPRDSKGLRMEIVR